MDLELESHEFDTIELFNRLAIKNFIGPQTHNVVINLLLSGGFIAGGFARRCIHLLGATIIDGKLVFRPGMYSSSVDDRKFVEEMTESQTEKEHARALFELGSYLGQAIVAPDRVNQWKNHKNDIDIFFPSKELRDNILKEPPWAGYHSHESIGGNAINIYCDSKTYIQAITRFVAPLPETLELFDIMNGSVALTSDRVYIPKRWYELERTKTLKMNHWRHDSTPRRANSWMMKHQYSQLHIDDFDMFSQKIEELFNRLVENEGIMIGNSDQVLYDMKKFLSMLKDPFYSKHLNGCLLTLFASLGQFYDKYNWALLELKRRGLPLELH